MFNIKRRERRINYGEGEKNFIQRLLSSKSGRIVFISGVILIVLLLVFMSAPTKKEMIREVNDNVMQCLGYTFTEADTAVIVPEILETYQKYNQLEAHRHLFYSTAYIHNNTHPEGTRVAIGFLGFVFSTVQYSDLLLDVEPVHKGYEQKLLDPGKIEETDLGTNPNVQEYHYEQNPVY